jgi:hypothetical protein
VKHGHTLDHAVILDRPIQMVADVHLDTPGLMVRGQIDVFDSVNQHWYGVQSSLEALGFRVTVIAPGERDERRQERI